jgi:transposase
MTRKRRSFTPEFKQEVASLVLDQGYTVSQTSTSLGVVKSVLRRGVKPLEAERQGVTPQKKAVLLPGAAPDARA